MWSKSRGLTAILVALLLLAAIQLVSRPSQADDVGAGESTSWEKTFNRLSTQDSSFSDCTVDPIGELVVVGACRNKNGDRDAAVIKYSPSGDVIWTRYFDNSGASDSFNGVDTGPDGRIFATGTSLPSAPGSRRDAFTVGLDPEGNTLKGWPQFYDRGVGEGDGGLDLVVNSKGDIVICGYSEDASAVISLALIKYSDDGVLAAGWPKYFLSGTASMGISVVQDASGDYVTAGHRTMVGQIEAMVCRFSPSGEIRSGWPATYSSPGGSLADLWSSVAVDQEGNYVCGGLALHSLIPPVKAEMLVAWYEPDGSIKDPPAVVEVPDSHFVNFEIPLRLAVAESNCVLLNGTLYDNTTSVGVASVFKFRPDGSQVPGWPWQRQGADSSVGAGVALAPSGAVYGCGLVMPTGGIQSGLVYKLDDAHPWYLSEGSTGSDGNGEFETWVLIQNPGPEVAMVELDYQTPSGAVQGPSFNLPGESRTTVNVADTVAGEWSVSTKVTSDIPVICERAVYWNSSEGTRRQAATDSIGSIAPWRTWFLAEGSTGSDYRGWFQTWILIQNPCSRIAEVKLHYQTPSGEVEGPDVLLEPGTRKTVNVADTVSNEWSVSTRVESNEPVVCERSIYWNSADGEDIYRKSATDSIGVTGPSHEWFLAEGSTGIGGDGKFETWVLVQNPGPKNAAVEFFYQTPSGEVVGPTVVLPPGTRHTEEVSSTVFNEWSVSTRVESNEPIVAERSVYWNYDSAGYRQVATDSIGASSPGSLWFLAEGSTGVDGDGYFETWILVQNPGPNSAKAKLWYQTPTEQVKGPELVLPAGTRQTVQVSATLPQQWSVSTKVESNEPVVCERSVYWHTSTDMMQSGHDSIGFDP